MRWPTCPSTRLSNSHIWLVSIRSNSDVTHANVTRVWHHWTVIIITINFYCRERHFCNLKMRQIFLRMGFDPNQYGKVYNTTPGPCFRECFAAKKGRTGEEKVVPMCQFYSPITIQICRTHITHSCIAAVAVREPFLFDAPHSVRFCAESRDLCRQ